MSKDKDVSEIEIETESNPPKPQENLITSKHVFSLAVGILITLAAIFFMAMLAYTFFPYPGAAIFDTCKTVLPPIATLVIGYYFGEKDR